MESESYQQNILIIETSLEINDEIKHKLATSKSEDF